MEIRFLREPAACAKLGYKRSTLHAETRAGLLTSQVKIASGRSSAWIEHELTAVQALRASGGDDAAVRALVRRLHEARAAMAKRAEADALAAAGLEA